MKKYLFVLFSFIAFSQPQTIEWQKTYGGSQYNGIKSIEQTTDGGYIMSGDTSSYVASGNQSQGALNGDFWITKINATGDIEWDNVYGGVSDEDYPRIKQTPDGGYIVAGSSISPVSGTKTIAPLNSSTDFWVLKLDSLGNIIWQKVIGGSSADSALCLELTNDGGAIICGGSFSNISFNKSENRRGGDDYWVVKLDAMGNVEWDKTLGGNDPEIAVAIKQTLDGGYIVGGSSYSNISGDKTEDNVSQTPNEFGFLNYDYWVVKLNATGQIEWQNTIGGNLDDHFADIIQTSDGNYVLLGTSWSNISGDKTENTIAQTGCNYWLVKLNQNGEILWDKTIGGLTADYAKSISQTSSNELLLVGFSYSGIGGYKTEPSRGDWDIWIVKLDSSGNFIWDKTYGGDDYDNGVIFKQTTDNGYILGSRSQSYISGDKTVNNQGIESYWILKLSPDNLATKQNSSSWFTYSPNPTSDIVSINFEKIQEKVTVTISTLLGQIISKNNYYQTENLICSIDAESGIYFVTIETNEEKEETIKIIKK
jgi:hypothetical protein